MLHICRYFGTHNGWLRAVNKSTGQVVFSFEVVNTAIESTPAVHEVRGHTTSSAPFTNTLYAFFYAAGSARGSNWFS